MKTYIKPTIDILAQRTETNPTDISNNEIEGIYKLVPVHTFSQNNNRTYDDTNLAHKP